MALDRRAKVNKEVKHLFSWFYQTGRIPKMGIEYCSGTKENGHIRVCIDFLNLNIACPMYP